MLSTHNSYIIAIPNYHNYYVSIYYTGSITGFLPHLCIWLYVCGVCARERDVYNVLWSSLYIIMLAALSVICIELVKLCSS